MKSSTNQFLLAAIASLFPTAAVFAQASPPQTAPSLSISSPLPTVLDLDPSRLMANSLADSTKTLIDPTSSQDMRDAAARRLLSIGSAEARSTILASLRDPGNSPARLAAARAIADDRPADPEFIDGLFVLLEADVPKPIVDAAVVALGNFKRRPEVAARLIDMSKAGQPEAQRLAAVRAMASQIEKRVAEQLIVLTQDASPAVSTAANDAVRQFASLELDSPADWWKTQVSVPEDQFRLDILDARTVRADGEKRRAEDTFQELKRSILAQISSAPRETRGDVLIGFLTSKRESVKLIAAAQAFDYAQTGDLPTTARPVIRDLLTDSDPDVRLFAARTLLSVNDTDAFPDIARQLAVESDARVRTELARTMGPIGNVDAVPILRSLLDDASTPVVVAASNALAVLGPAIAQRSATGAADLAIKLQAVLQAHVADKTSEGPRLREALVKALVPLKQQSMLAVFKSMLTNSSPRETEAIRALAVTGLGAIGRAETAGLLVEALRDESSTVRAQAAQALGQLGVANATFENAEAIYHAMERESDIRVLASEWTAIKQLMAFAPMNQLARWPDLALVHENNIRLLDVYTVLEQKTAAAQAWDDETHYLEEIGNTLMSMGEAADNAHDSTAARQHYNDATEPFQNALTLTRTKGGPAMRVQTMIIDTVKSMLRARDYVGAAKFASDEFHTGGESLQGTIGPEFKLEAERLLQSDGPNHLDDAQALIKAALGMTPALASQYRGHLEDVQRSIDLKLHEKNQYAIPEFWQSLALAQ